MSRALSPTFTLGKIKGMFSPMEGIADRMVAKLSYASSENDGQVNVKPIFQAVSLDSISNCAFGVETDSFNKPDNELFRMCLNSFSGLVVWNWLESLFFFAVTHLNWLGKYLETYDHKAFQRLWDITKVKRVYFKKQLELEEILFVLQDIAENRVVERGDFVDRVKEIKEKGLLNEKQAYAQVIWQ